jgi:chemotaxis signal transduction protein
VLSPVASKIAELRNAFDRTRASPFSLGTSEQTENLIAVRVSRDAYAIRVSEISGLVTDRKIVAFPTPVSDLLGLTGVRGALVPVYSLTGLLGYNIETEQARWLALCGTDEPVALAFSSFEGYVRIPLAHLYLAEQKDMARTYVTHVMRAPDMVRAVVSIPLIREAIQKRCGNSSVSKEQ